MVTAWEAGGSARLDRSLEQRAREASVDSAHVRIATLEQLYAKYRRSSGVAHGDLRADSLVLEHTSALASLNAQDTAAALIVCVAAAAHALGIEVEVKSVLEQLRRALERP